jgi:hypothetical protein
MSTGQVLYQQVSFAGRWMKQCTWRADASESLKITYLAFNPSLSMICIISLSFLVLYNSVILGRCFSKSWLVALEACGSYWTNENDIVAKVKQFAGTFGGSEESANCR